MTSILTALSLLAHMLLGCCWHHEHACTERPVETVAVAMCDGHAPDHEASESADRESSDEHRHQSELCEGPQCLTLLRDSACVPCPDQVVLPAIVPEVAAQLDTAFQVAFEASADWRVPLPLRPHLLYQLLLI